MSGITGIITTKSTPKVTLQAMTDILSHRGPDGEGHYVAAHVALGYRHFDVYNLTKEQAGTMLFLNRYAVTFDGRVYNLPELQEELREQGYNFDCLSEAQLLAAAYDCWGVDCLNKFNGEWAFVLYDIKADHYFIARDRFGIKPLYYYQDAEKFIFGSEVKAIYASQQVKKSPNEAFLKAYLEKGSNEYDTPTAFVNVLRFPFAHYFLGTRQQLLATPAFIRYWDVQVNTSREKYCPNKAKQFAQQYYDLLADAVRIRMCGEVKVGAALSGGLDSSSIVYLMNKQLKLQGSSERLQTFSSVYKTPGTEDCDESQFINLLAQELDVDSNQVEPKPEDVPEMVKQSVYANETLSNGIGVSNYCVASKLKEENHKVILNGQGADEILAGYSFFILDYLTDLSLFDFISQLKLYKENISKNKELALWFYQGSQLLLGRKLSSKVNSILFSREMNGQLNSKLQASVKTDLVNLLHYAEHISSALSVETRVPYMDHRLIEFLADVPGCYKIHDGWTKYIARKAFENKLPNEITWREDKMGWPVPLTFWFNNDLKDWLKFHVSNDEELKENEIIRKINMSYFTKTFFNER